MRWSSYILGLLTGLVLAGLYYWKRHGGRPRADVHLKVRRGQSADEMVSGMVRAIAQVDGSVAEMKRQKEQAEQDRDYWRARAEEGGKIWSLQLRQAEGKKER